VATLHRETSDLCETDVRRMNHADMSSDDDDDVFETDEDGGEGSRLLADEKEKLNKQKSKMRKNSRLSPVAGAGAGAGGLARKLSSAKSRSTSRIAQVVGVLSSDSAALPSTATATDPPSSSSAAAAAAAASPSPSGGALDRKTYSRGGSNLYDIIIADKTFEHSVALTGIFAEFRQGRGPGVDGGGGGGGGRRSQRAPLVRQLSSSSSRNLMDYGAKFRDLMGDKAAPAEAKCWRIYS
jgi:hypothetical protein